MKYRLFPFGTAILASFEDENRDRIFFIRTVAGQVQRLVRCGCTGAWLDWRIIFDPSPSRS